MSDKLTFDFDAVTPRMLLDFKDKTGQSLMGLIGTDGAMNLDDLSEEMIAGIIWLSLRMSGRHDATWDDALDTPFTALDFGEEPAALDPTSASRACSIKT